ncbi:MAG: glycoside hydrolase [Oscillospiraceae bacterium]|nr:glycoside hydrolase [Oscillospiraceae bacterium]
MNVKRLGALLLSATVAMPILPQMVAVAEDSSYAMNVTVDLSGEHKEISPYIYGVNIYGNENRLKDLRVNAVRQGGNRMTAYNWENNASNAGSDWKHSSDDNLTKSNEPAAVAQELSEQCVKNDVAYKFTTLQLAGYVAADKNGPVSEAEAAPSDRWNEVVFTKNSAFSDTPDLTDGVVYMDEYVNYIVKTLGDSKTSTGMQGYSLDNEPALWSSTHSRMHADPVTVKELSEKSVEVAKAVKSIDPNAEVFGPALYGYTAYDHLADVDDWNAVKESGNYHWYLDSYLDDMKKASDAYGSRLLDVVDIHYYTESGRNGAEDRLQSVRTLYEEGFAENSWIGQWCQENIPILPTIQKSIDTYFPGTKLAISEYNFGGNDLSATIAQAEALGCYADAGVYLATLWDGSDYIFSGMKLYTNYDGKGGSFGNTLVPTKTDDVSLASSYSAINGNDDSQVTVMLTNKSFTQSENATITLANSNANYKAAGVYAVYGDSEEIRLIDIIDNISDNTVNVTLPAYSAAMIVVTDDASDFADKEIYDDNKTQQTVVNFDNFDTMINQDGYLEIPIDDPEHLKKVILTADVTSSAGSSYGGAGCALCVNVKTPDGTKFWSSKSYTLTLGANQTATVNFDGTFSNDDEILEAVIADGKIEVQKWWDYSEKQELDLEDIISVNYTNIQVVYEKENSVDTGVIGDVNADGEFSLTDIIAMQKWLLGNGKLPNSKAGDLDNNGLLNIYDFCLMKNLLLRNEG